MMWLGSSAWFGEGWPGEFRGKVGRSIFSTERRGWWMEVRRSEGGQRKASIHDDFTATNQLHLDQKSVKKGCRHDPYRYQHRTIPSACLISGFSHSIPSFELLLRLESHLAGNNAGLPPASQCSEPTFSLIPSITAHHESYIMQAIF
jgi:hypothetical protein